MQLRWLRPLVAVLCLASVAKAEETPSTGPAALPGKLSFDLHGYYRARFVHAANVPVGRIAVSPLGVPYLASEPHVGRDDASTANYFTNRLRLEPALQWGEEGQAPRVALRSQIDLLDTVLWGDNARQSSVPLFASNPSNTSIDGTERPMLLVRRLWLEVALPVGQLRVGRQASHGGLGLLFNDGNGFRNDFGDADGGSTFDRVMFATQPLTIFNAITRGDKRPTPLLLVLAYDRLVQDTLGFGSDPTSTDRRLSGGPYGFLSEPTCGGKNDPAGATVTEKCDASVGQFVTGLIWRDDKLKFRQDSDELLAGAIYSNRSQGFSDSRLHIVDLFWRLKMGLAKTGPSLLTEGEVALIRGQTKGVKILAGAFDDVTGESEEPLRGEVLNYAARVGLTTRVWDGLVEVGHSSGDEQLIGGDLRFKMYPMSPDHRVGLLMYPVALHARSYNTLAGRASDALHGGGGVFNSTYLNPKARYRIHKESWQAEFVGQAVLAWADTLNGGQVRGFTADYYAPRNAADPWANNTCSVFDPACALGWEVDVAVKLKWLPADLPGAGVHDRFMLQWSNEFGLMQAGRALEPRLAQGAGTLWTVQSRLAFMW